MSLRDGIFVEEVENDITQFAEDSRKKRVLVFPPVNNYRRFLIHQLVQDRFGELSTFSIGQGIARRTVVCYESDVIGSQTLNGIPSKKCVELTDCHPSETAVGTMGVEDTRRLPVDSMSPEHSRMRQDFDEFDYKASSMRRPKLWLPGSNLPINWQHQLKTSPAVEIYRPPAARRASRDGQTLSATTHNANDSSSSAKSNRQRRPDRAVYVPKHRRSTEVDDAGQPAEETIVGPCRSTRCNRRTSSPSLEGDSIRKPFWSRDDHEDRNYENGAPDDEQGISGANCSLPTELFSKKERIASDEPIREDILVQDKLPTLEDSSPIEEIITTANRGTENEPEVPDSKSPSEFHGAEKQVSLDGNSCPNEEIIVEPSEDAKGHRGPEVASGSECTSGRTGKKIEEKEPRDSEERTNSKNLRLSASSVLVISDMSDRAPEEKPAEKKYSIATAVSPPEKKPKKVARVKSKPASPPSPPVKLNRDECDWDSLFDDNGECLDPTLIEELTAAVGEVTIEQPKNDYKAFSKTVEVSNDEFGHVIEIYNFPSDFKTSDLAAVFTPWKNGGYELKWVDDTHCLGVFSSPLVAAEVLASDHPFVKTRPLSHATSLSKTKARKSAEFLQPYKSRPETCAALARRLVTGALGVKLATARQEREQEKVLLREAKERRRLANKQRDDVWEGIIAEK